MQTEKYYPVLLALAAGMSFSAVAAFGADPAPPGKPTIAKICTNCHKAEPNAIRGTFDNVAFKSKTIQVKIDDAIELIKFDEDEIKVTNSEGKAGDGEFLRKTKKGSEIKVEFVEKNGVKTGVKLIEKQPIKVSADKLMKTADIESLVAQGPVKGKYTLVDSRPLPRFQEGAIPTAINIPYPAFDKMKDKLPADKNATLVFYCSGSTWAMSPNSARKAEQLGYTNVKVYHEGLPAWSKSNYSVLSAQFLKEAWVDKDIPVVLLDARSEQEASKGYIKGAVAFPAEQAAALVKKLELKQKNTPIIVYDENQGAQAVTVAKELIKEGYVNVKILTGGFAAWQSAKFEAASGKLAEKASYVPKPRPGEISVAEFEKYAAQLPANIMIIDVRNTDEGNAGMLKTAKLIPAEEIKDRGAEIPKDKLIITHCSTGIRAEMAYHTLKEMGYTNVKFVNAKIDFEKNGSYKITKE